MEINKKILIKKIETKKEILIKRILDKKMSNFLKCLESFAE